MSGSAGEPSEKRSQEEESVDWYDSSFSIFLSFYAYFLLLIVSLMVAGNDNLKMPEAPMDEVVTDPTMAPGEEPIDFGRIPESMLSMLVCFPFLFSCCLLRRGFPLC